MYPSTTSSSASSVIVNWSSPEPVALALARDEVAPGDRELLGRRVPVDLDDLHPVAERRRDRLEVVGRRDEQDLREVVVQLEVVVVEAVVLLGVEDLEERRGRVAPEVRPQLVDLVEHEHRVRGPGPLQALDDPARERPDVGPPVAPDLGLVADAAEADPVELAAQRPGDRLAQRRLAHARWTVEQQDRRLHVALELEHGEVLQDPLLDVVEPVVVLVQDLLGAGDVELVLGRVAPGEVQDRLGVVPDDAVLGTGGVRPGQLGQLLLQRLDDRLGQVVALVGQLVPELVGVPARPLGLAQLVLDGLELLAQEELPLLLVHVGLDLGPDLLGDLEHADLLLEVVQDQLGPVEQGARLQQALLFLDVDLQVRRDKVDQEARALDVLDRVGRLARQVRRQVDDLDGQLLDRADAGVELDRVYVARRVLLDGPDPGGEVGVELLVPLDLDPALALDHDAHRPVGHLDQLEDGGRRADLVQVVGAGRLHLGALLGDHADQPVAGVGVLDQLQAGVAPDRDRQHDPGVQDRVAERQDGERVRQLGRVHLALLVGRQEGDGLLGVPAVAG